ncbi:MAG: hypothetical protein KGI71_05835 [Patescibacteria group bacterium]|nr:hypothetical protein [Patescibacteria group bacterium]
MTGDLDEWLDHWARWSVRTDDCYPDGWEDICGSAEAALWMPYRNGDPSVEEKLAALELAIEPDPNIAERVEGWVMQIGEPMRTALRVDRVYLPEPMRVRLHRTPAEWLDWRATALNRALRGRYPGRWHIGSVEYQEAVWDAIEAVRMAILMWARSV